MKIRLPWYKPQEIVCPDGSVKFVHHDLDRIFPLHISSKKSSAQAALDVAKQAKAKLSRQHQEKVEQVLVAINESNANTQMACRAHYTVYAASPCEGYDYYKLAMDRSTKHQERMQQTKIALDNLVRMATAKTMSVGALDVMTVGLTEVLRSLSFTEPAQVLIEKMNEVSTNSLEWQR